MILIGLSNFHICAKAKYSKLEIFCTLCPYSLIYQNIAQK